MKISVEIILGLIALVFFLLSAKEYLSNNRKFTPRIKTRLMVSIIFFIVILFNLLMSKN